MAKRDYNNLFVEDDYATGASIYYEDEELKKPFNGMFYDLSYNGLIELGG